MLLPTFRKGDIQIVASYSRMPHYQAYYWLSLSLISQFSVQKAPWWYKVLPAITALDGDALLENLRPKFGMCQHWHSPDLSDFVGCYVLKHNGKKIKFAIDSHDLKDVMSEDALAWSDVYFKANKWDKERYPTKVVPIVNGNGFLRGRHLNNLKKYRNTPKKCDILFISRIWGGMEHNVKLFEELASLPGKKRLIAIFVSGTASSQETEDAKKRLEAVGVECTYDLFPITQLWQEIAASKLVFIRAGKYMCIPWRMIDLLCMGACIVTDSDFYPVWPEALKAGQHYVSANIHRPADTSSASFQEFEKIRATVLPLLEDESKQNQLRYNSASYYDNYANPVKVGKYILSQVLQR